MESSVRWLKENHPEYTGGGTHWPTRLASSLIKMSWREVELVKGRGLFKEAYVAKIREAVTDWNKSKHDEMVSFIDRGGYAAEDAALTGEVFTVISEDESESIALEMDEVDDAVSSLSPKAEMSPDHELEEIVADAAKQADARYGAW